MKCDSCSKSDKRTELKKDLFLVFSLTLLLFLLGAGCKKAVNYHTTIKGLVIENGTGKRISGAMVTLNQATGGSYGSVSNISISSVISDGNGNFSFDFTASSSSTYQLFAKDAPYFNSGWLSVQVGQANTINILLDAPSYVKFHVKNINSNQSIDIYGTIGAYPSLYGVKVDTTFISTGAPSGQQNIYWSVLNPSNITSKFSGQVTTTPFDTIPFNINY
jgi:hypothetical protein